MGHELNERVLGVVMESGANDYDQRSAMGMARSWLHNGKPIKRQEYWEGQFRLRDDLAEALIEVLDGEDRSDCSEALAGARAVVNAPFLDLTMNGQRVKARIEKRGGRDGAEPE